MTTPDPTAQARELVKQISPNPVLAVNDPRVALLAEALDAARQQGAADARAAITAEAERGEASGEEAKGYWQRKYEQAEQERDALRAELKRVTENLRLLVQTGGSHSTFY